MARERKDVSSLDSGVPLLFLKTKQKERRTRGGRGGVVEAEGAGVGGYTREEKRGGRNRRGREEQKRKGGRVAQKSLNC